MADLIDPPGEAAVRVDVRDEDQTLVVRLSGELDMTGADRVRSAVDAALRDQARVVFEVAGLEFIDSSGLALLAAVAGRVPEVRLRDPTDIVRRLVELTGLTAVLRITP